MQPPHLTFFVELETEPLEALFSESGVTDFLVRGGHAISLGILDTDKTRARVIRQLEGRGIAVTGWLLLDSEDGYWLTADNPELAQGRYREVNDWAQREGLKLARIGLDIEAPKAHLDRLLENPLGGILERLRQRRTFASIARAEAIYEGLVAEIRRHGRGVETYQFPVILDERKAKSALIRRALGIVNVEADAEVLMLYQSYFGKSALRTYFPETKFIALGVTGGGVNADKPKVEPKIGFAELEGDLLSAAQFSRDLYVFSLEGCVAQNMLPQIEAMDWSKEPRAPSPQNFERAQRRRRFLQWVCENEQLIDRVLPRPSERSPGLLSRLLTRANDRLPPNG